MKKLFFVIEFFYESKDFRDNNLKAIKKLIKFQEIQKIDFKSYQNNDIRLFYLNLLLKKVEFIFWVRKNKIDFFENRVV